MSPQPGDVTANTVGADNLTPFAAAEILGLHGVTDEPQPRNLPLQYIVIAIIFWGLRFWYLPSADAFLRARGPNCGNGLNNIFAAESGVCGMRISDLMHAGAQALRPAPAPRAPAQGRFFIGND